MSTFTTCELCNRDYNAALNAASNPHRCEPEALVARILALKAAVKSERKRSPETGTLSRDAAVKAMLAGIPAPPVFEAKDLATVKRRLAK